MIAKGGMRTLQNLGQNIFVRNAELNVDDYEIAK